MTDQSGTVTAGNSSPLSDGAGLLLIGDESVPGDPLARVVSGAVHGVDPDMFGIGRSRQPGRRSHAPGSAGVTSERSSSTRRFAAQSLACIKQWPDLDPAIVNVNGGVIAIGHPLGASGARLIAGLAYELRRGGGGDALAALCIGVGQGLAIVLQA